LAATTVILIVGALARTLTRRSRGRSRPPAHAAALALPPPLPRTPAPAHQQEDALPPPSPRSDVAANAWAAGCVARGAGTLGRGGGAGHPPQRRSGGGPPAAATARWARVGGACRGRPGASGPMAGARHGVPRAGRTGRCVWPGHTQASPAVDTPPPHHHHHHTHTYIRAQRSMRQTQLQRRRWRTTAPTRCCWPRRSNWHARPSSWAWKLCCPCAPHPPPLGCGCPAHV
jgi:hypothetical protein